MTLLTFATATDLARWAATKDAQTTLPILVRRLVRATTPTLDRAAFPGGDSVGRPGWDGIVRAREATAFVSAGGSVWEMGADTNPRSKAEADYAKRSKNPAGVIPKDTVYVAVTPRRWQKKYDWAREKAAEGIWKGIRVLDADDLEQWLEAAPAVHFWISHLLGKHPAGAEDLERYWAAYTAAAEPPLKPELLIAGRDAVVAAIRAVASGDQETHAVVGETRHEAIGIIVSALLTLPQADHEDVLARTLMVHDAESVRHLATTASPLILIPTFQGIEIGRVRAARHRLLLPAERNAPRDLLDPLEGLNRDAAKAFLRAAGKKDTEARTLARVAARSFAAFYRKLAVRPETQRPAWSDPVNGPTLVPSLLLGSWSGGKTADRTAVEDLTGKPYDAAIGDLRRWLHEPDSPIREVDGTWFLPTKEDAWTLLAPYVTNDHLTRFRTVAERVLVEPDPRYDLPRDEQWRASLTNHVLTRSGYLAEGIAESLAVLGTVGAKRVRAGSVTGAHVAATTVGKVLSTANTNWRIWAALSHCLPLLAEAAPQVFLSAVEAGLSGGDPTLIHLFLPDDTNFTAPTPHTGLLWALERLAWSPEHLARAAVALARLAERDPGGRMANRPMASLRHIFLPWFPQTAASVTTRLAVLEIVQKRCPEVAWKLLKTLLPRGYDTAPHNPQPEWQPWAEGAVPTTTGDLLTSAHEMTQRLLNAAGTNAACLAELIEAAPNLPPDERQLILDRVKTVREELGDRDRTVLWKALREVVAQHRSFKDAEWALPGDIVQQFATLLPLFEPERTEDQFGWLFTHHAQLIDPPSGDFDEQREAVSALQHEVIQTIYDGGGVDAVLNFARTVAVPYEVGNAFAKINLSPEIKETLIREHLSSDDPVAAQLAQSVTWDLARGSLKWVREWLRADPPLRADQQAILLAMCDPVDEVLALVDAQDEHVQREYWRRMLPYSATESSAERIAQKLLAYQRPHMALEVLATHHRRKRPLDAEVAAAVLERLLQPGEGDDRPGQIEGHNIGQLLDVVTEPGRLPTGRAAALEWAYLPALSRFIRRPKFLHRALADEPQLFIDMISLIFRPASERGVDVEVSAEQANKARAAYELLDTWDHIPGRGENGIDSARLMAWVVETRTLAAAADRAEIADLEIGEMLGRGSRGTPWPPPAVCDVLEEIESDDLRHGFTIGVYNRRGVTSRGLEDGGKQERALAATYRAHAAALATRWPGAAAVVNEIADHYDHHARRMDERAALHKGLEF